jgi:hypothetical protein
MPNYKASTPTERVSHVEPGEYAVEIIDAVESISKRGHEMIELKLRTEEQSILYDFLVFTETAFWKIDAFRESIGEQVTPDEEVEINADDLIGRTGYARLVTEEYDGRKRNKVAAWLKKPASRPAISITSAPAPSDDDDDNIPF